MAFILKSVWLDRNSGGLPTSGRWTSNFWLGRAVLSTSRSHKKQRPLKSNTAISLSLTPKYANSMAKRSLLHDVQSTVEQSIE